MPQVGRVIQSAGKRMTKAYRFEFDSGNKILLMRFGETRITDELFGEAYKALRQYAIATNPNAVIGDFSAATQVELSVAFLQQLALEEPAVPQAGQRGRIAVFSCDAGLGAARMFQMFAGSTRPLLHVVQSLDEALEALGVESTQFEPLP